MLDMVVNCNSMDWQEAGGVYPPGTKMKMLRDDEGGKTVIFRLPKGFRLESHCHITNEQHYVIKGQYELDGRVYNQGTYQLIHAKMDHGPFTSETGAEILAIWS